MQDVIASTWRVDLGSSMTKVLFVFTPSRDFQSDRNDIDYRNNASRAAIPGSAEE